MYFGLKDQKKTYPTVISELCMDLMYSFKWESVTLAPDPKAHTPYCTTGNYEMKRTTF